ncbi:MAG: sialidase family protein [Actinomycetota bacterium]
MTSQGWILEAGDKRNPVLVVVRSQDGGRTWTDVTPIDAPSPLGDPFMHLDPRTGRLFTAEYKPDSCYQFSYSDDAGDHWTPVPEVCGLVDHENIFTAPPVSSATLGYPDVVYLCANTGGFGTLSTADQCMKSLNGGLSFAPTGDLPYSGGDSSSDGGTGQGVGGPDGTIYLPKGWNGHPYLAISHDEGATWSRVQVSSLTLASEYFDSVQGYRYADQAGVAVDEEGNLYYDWVGPGGSLYLNVSRDGGATWSSPLNITPPGVVATSLPAIEVGTPGRIAAAYMGSRVGSVFWDGFITVTTNALGRRPLFYATRVNPPSDPLVYGSCGTTRCADAGDFFDVTIGPDGRPWASFVDACSSTCAQERGPNDTSEGVVGSFMGGPTLRPAG